MFISAINADFARLKVEVRVLLEQGKQKVYVSAL